MVAIASNKAFHMLERIERCWESDRTIFYKSILSARIYSETQSVNVYRHRNDTARFLYSALPHIQRAPFDDR